MSLVEPIPLTPGENTALASMEITIPPGVDEIDVVPSVTASDAPKRDCPGAMVRLKAALASLGASRP